MHEKIIKHTNENEQNDWAQKFFTFTTAQDSTKNTTGNYKTQENYFIYSTPVCNIIICYLNNYCLLDSYKTSASVNKCLNYKCKNKQNVHIQK